MFVCQVGAMGLKAAANLVIPLSQRESAFTVLVP